LFGPLLKPPFKLLIACLALTSSACFAPRSNTLLVSPLQACDEQAPLPSQIKIVSYNIKSAEFNGDRLEDLAQVLRGLNPDIVALQEVQSHGEDQATLLARTLGYPYHVFAAAIRKAPGDYGIALLSRFPLEKVERVRLDYPLASESRVAIDATACVGSRRIHFVNVHADFLPFANAGNTRVLARYLQPELASPVVLMGDLNATPGDDAVRALSSVGLHDLFAELVSQPSPTFPSDKPRNRIDYVMTDASLVPFATPPSVPETEASDHRPITATFNFPATALNQVAGTPAGATPALPAKAAAP